MQLSPAGRYLDQEALIPQVVVHLAVGVCAGIGPKGSPLRCITPCGLQDAEHGDLLQVFLGMAGAARDIAGHGLGDVAVLERQGIGGGMGIDRPVPPRPGRKGDHQLNCLLAGRGPCALGVSRTPRHAAGHHRRPQGQGQLA